jgi:hypothetical protein
MTSLDNKFSFSDWMPYPTGSSGLLSLRIIAPVSIGVYGMLSNQLLITSNHEPSLVRIGKIPDVAALSLDGGGFPINVAASFQMLSESEVNRLLADQSDLKSRIITLLIPQSLAAAWKWKTGETHIGCMVKVISDSATTTDVSVKSNVPSPIVRLSAGLRLAIGQILLMALPVLLVHPMALAWVAPILIVAASILSGFWPLIPGYGWIKGLITGIFFGGLSIIPVIFRVFPTIVSWPHLLPLGILIIFTWIGGVLMGAQPHSQFNGVKI